MKKTLLLLFVALFVATLGSAQTVIGLRAGINTTNFNRSQDLEERYDVLSNIGITSGVFTEFTLFGSSFSLQPEILYTQRNTTWNTQDNYPRYSIKRTTGDKDDIKGKQKTVMNYIDVPLMLKYKFRGRSSQFYLQAGTRLSFGISAKASRSYAYQATGKSLTDEDKELFFKTYMVEATTTTDNLEFGNTTSDEFNKTNFSMLLGAGYVFEIEDVGFFSIDARYSLSSGTIFNPNLEKNSAKYKLSEMIKIDEESYAKFKGFMFTLSYAYPLGGF